MKTSKGKIVIFLLFLLILLTAVFFRFWSLNDAPPGLYPDEAMNAINATRVQESGDFDVFYSENNGREGLYMNITAIAFDICGRNINTLRMVSSFFGVLMVAGIFFFSWVIWGYKMALLSSYLSAISFWAVNFSRIGFRAIILPAILVWSFGFLWLGLKKKKIYFFLISGLIFGVGMHTYISFRVMPLVLILFSALLFFDLSYNKKDILRWGFVFLVASLVVASPLLIYYLQNPADFMGRADQVSIFNESSPLLALGEGAVKTLGMFNFVGDFNWRHNISGRPLLFWPIGIGFLLGILLLLRGCKKGNKKVEVFLLLWFFIGLVPNFLAPEGAPHALRALAVMPVVFIISAKGMWWLYKKTQRYLSRFQEKNKNKYNQIRRIKRELALLAIILLLFLGVWEARVYFVEWAFNSNTKGAFTERLVQAGEFLRGSDSKNKYVVINDNGKLIDGIHIESKTIEFITWDIRGDITFINKEDINQLPSSIEDGLLVVSLEDADLIENLNQKYKGSKIIKTSPFGVIRVP